MKVVVAGASGGIGLPLSLLLKTCPLVTELSLYDVVNTPGVAADLSHINTNAKITGGFLPKDDGPKHAFTDAGMVIIPAGIPRKPGMTRDQLFNTNAGIVRDLVNFVAQYAPDAFVLIISNPINSTVPIAAETLKAADKFKPEKLFGVTTLDVVRANTFLAQVGMVADVNSLKVPVVGGHSGETIVPLFSQASPQINIPVEALEKLTKRVQFGGDEVVKAKDGLGSATLSMAYAGFRFAESVIRAAQGSQGIVECSFVFLPGVEGGSEIAGTTGVDFFAVPIELGVNGAQRAVNVLPQATEYEKKLLEEAGKELKKSIAKGVEFMNPDSK